MSLLARLWIAVRGAVVCAAPLAESGEEVVYLYTVYRWSALTFECKIDTNLNALRL